MRSTIARRLSESKRDIPHYRLVADLDMDALAGRRASLVASGLRISINDLLLHAIATALQQHPRLNAQFAGEELLQYDQVDLAVAVATPGGLVTPIVRDAANQSVQQIAAAVRDLAERARAGKLAREEITGGTFTVSSLGMFGVRQFDAIINPPQVAILAIGAMQERPVVRNGALAVGHQVTVSLSSDHRVVDGADARASSPRSVKSSPTSPENELDVQAHAACHLHCSRWPWVPARPHAATTGTAAPLRTRQVGRRRQRAALRQQGDGGRASWRAAVQAVLRLVPPGTGRQGAAHDVPADDGARRDLRRARRRHHAQPRREIDAPSRSSRSRRTWAAIIRFRRCARRSARVTPRSSMHRASRRRQAGGSRPRTPGTSAPTTRRSRLPTCRDSS